ncbi:MAG: glycosyltransferase family 39 protein [Vicinamibacterales bacterium]
MTKVHGPWRLSAGADRAIAVLLLILAALYLVPFVHRGWVPIDEGMIGEAAERVMNGALPHVDYEEPYPGALSYLYASVFRFAGIDLVNLRWTVFIVALPGLGLVYAILRRQLRPTFAALATWVALGWSFPNYFSSLPSWWLLLCALVSLWGVIRYVETNRLMFAAAAGLAAGIAITIKQTGIYLMPPLIMALMISGSDAEPPSSTRARVDTVVRALIATGAFLFVVLIMRSGLGSGEFLYLIAPIAASCTSFVLVGTSTRAAGPLNLQAPALAVATAAVPIFILLMPHLSTHQVGAFIHGVLVLPQKRLQFTTLPMRPPTQMVAAVAGLLWIFWAPRSLAPRELRVVALVRWTIAVALVVFSVRSQLVYMFIWEAVRGMAAVLPIMVLWLLASGTGTDIKQSRVLFATSAILAWASLGQFPFASPIYFCYVAPLALIAGVIVVKRVPQQHRLSDGPALAIALLFALLCLNRDYVWNMGWFHQVQRLDTPFGLSRASLRVDAEEARIYGRVVPLVQQHLGTRGLVAGPDTPELYFLTGQFSRSGRLFDFFSLDGSASDAQVLSDWTSADVIVLYHRRRFSPPLSSTIIDKLRQEFPQGEAVAPFEVRWR